MSLLALRKYCLPSVYTYTTHGFHFIFKYTTLSFLYSVCVCTQGKTIAVITLLRYNVHTIKRTLHPPLQFFVLLDVILFPSSPHDIGHPLHRCRWSSSSSLMMRTHALPFSHLYLTSFRRRRRQW